MTHINDPVTEWEITITELALSDDHPGRRFFNEHRFKTIAALKEYFERPGSYPIAKSLSYNVPEPSPEKFNPRCVGRLSFHYEDRIMKPTWEFDNVRDFVKYLEMHPSLAECVNYVKKK